MSLKAFHIFFIALSALMCLGIAAWRLVGMGEDGTGGMSAIMQAVAAAAAGFGLIEYGRRFLKKTKELGYL